jgi:hypothetical protein
MEMESCGDHCHSADYEFIAAKNKRALKTSEKLGAIHRRSAERERWIVLQGGNPRAAILTASPWTWPITLLHTSPQILCVSAPLRLCGKLFGPLIAFLTSTPSEQAGGEKKQGSKQRKQCPNRDANNS